MIFAEWFSWVDWLLFERDVLMVSVIVLLVWNIYLLRGMWARAIAWIMLKLLGRDSC